MMNLLGLQNERVFIGGFDRPNLYFRVVSPVDKTMFILSYLQRHKQDSGIIYAATRKEVERCTANCAAGACASASTTPV